MTSKFAIICKKCGGNGGLEVEQRMIGNNNILPEYIRSIKCEHCDEVEYL